MHKSKCFTIFQEDMFIHILVLNDKIKTFLNVLDVSLNISLSSISII